jgi:hypothetical protein
MASLGESFRDLCVFHMADELDMPLPQLTVILNLMGKIDVNGIPARDFSTVAFVWARALMSILEVIRQHHLLFDVLPIIQCAHRAGLFWRRLFETNQSISLFTSVLTGAKPAAPSIVTAFSRRR